MVGFKVWYGHILWKNDASATIEVTEKSLEIVLMVSSEDKTTFCEICDFKSVSKKVLDVHIKRKHGNIRELDENMK